MLSKASTAALCPICCPSQWAARALLCGEAGVVYKMTPYLHLVLRLKIRGTVNVLPLYAFMV
jgi:hypothetical protein